MLLDQVTFLDQRITAMEDQAIAALAQMEQSWGVDATGETGPGCGPKPVPAAAERTAAQQVRRGRAGHRSRRPAPPRPRPSWPRAVGRPAGPDG